EDLARVQKEREWPTRVIQRIQATVQNRVVARVLQSQTEMRIPWTVRLFFKIPFLKNTVARILGFGVRPEHVEN
ncbi:MAG TPA: hypothetical protein VK738_12475, partial [Terriglobales bacterium]|nr:hypothetical protein [Terriglobales bacterium]